jgi:Putative stress-induced transcription regulator
MKRKELKTEPAPGDLRFVTDFVNTADHKRREDLWSSPEALATWLAGKGLLPVGTELSEADLERAVVVREGLRALLCSHNGAGLRVVAVREMDLAVAAASLRVRFDDRGEMSFEPVPGGIDAAVARLLSFVEEARRLGHWRFSHHQSS